MMTVFQRAQSDSQGGFGKKFECGELRELSIVCGIEEKYMEYRPESRPLMSVVVKMLEGAVEIPTPFNPFQHKLVVTSCTNGPFHPTQTDSNYNSECSFQMSSVRATSGMRKYEIEMAST
ncbi:hypothetical protein SO802_000336 [Lithocarpus litseifolius]|uniref:Uncharacterized protein n=1 Tax=Lithocarpus litseifolius TaxID=425828 RepID=A0AAW2DRB1_9ROSI